MARLPIPGSDQGNWGKILNDYLSQAHNPNGLLKTGIVTTANLAQEVKDKIDIIAGQQGATGPSGPQGPTGSQGPAGVAGSAGPQGASGTSGAPGSVGATGASGTPGTTGQTGATGPAGVQGATGPQGPAGTNGSIGATGPQGPQGEPGPAATVGATGPQGDLGETGATGPQGPSGASGTPGVQGATGPAGLAGTQGATGPAGTTTWSGITDKPAVIAAGASAAAARSVIGAAPTTGISLDATTDSASRLAMTSAERTKLANLSGAVYVTTVGATLPGGLADGTLIARYTASGPATPVVTNVGMVTTIASGTTLAVTTTAAIPAGDVIAVAINRSSASVGQIMGSATVGLSAGAVDSWTRASANRAATHDVALVTARVTTTIPSGTTVTITTSTNGSNRGGAIVAGISHLSSGAPNATSGDDAAGQDRSTNNGPNANGVSLTAPTDAATTVPHTLVLGAFATGGTATFTWGAGQVEVGQVVTTAGSSDRGVCLGYMVVHTTGVQSMTINSDTSGGQAGVAMALPIELVEV